MKSVEGVFPLEFEPRKILVTGGAGFIGSNFVHQLLSDPGVERITILDKLTYSGHAATLAPLEQDSRVTFIHGDICDAGTVDRALEGCECVVNFAAETHVDRSLLHPAGFIQTNVHGTWVLLEAVRRRAGVRMVQISTDEVYGAVLTGVSIETDRLHPRNPYSASKAGAEMMAIAYAETHGTDVLITRGSNTYGPYQYPEKFIPLMITNVLERREIPVYGDGMQVRHWIHAEDHCSGIATVLRRGLAGEIYNIGTDDERTNLSVAEAVVDLLDAPPDLVTHVTDRPGHDRRYALSSAKLRKLGWSPKWTFEEGLADTVTWYRNRRDWWEAVRDGSFDEYYEANYGYRTPSASHQQGSE